MAFGVATKNVKTRNSYTIESFYEAIKDKAFTAGTPSLTKHGPATVITFPPLDRQNQVWIIKNGFGKSVQKFMVQKAEAAGMGNMILNDVLDEVTGGGFKLGQLIGSTAQRCEELVKITAQELEEMGL